jgi:hypothetical protein
MMLRKWVGWALLLVGTLAAASCSGADTPSAAANIACSGFTGQNGGGGAYLACLQSYR